MMLLEELTTRSLGLSPRPSVRLPEVRPSFLDPHHVCEPWIDACPRDQVLIFFVLNRPIALLPGSSLDHFSLNILMMQLRQRSPRPYHTMHGCSRLSYDG